MGGQDLSLQGKMSKYTKGEKTWKENVCGTKYN